MGRWREISVTADVGIEVEGDSLEDLFQTAAEGMIALMFQKKARLSEISESFKAYGDDIESALVNVLSEILYIIEVKNVVPAMIRVKAKGDTSYHVVVEGERFDPSKHKMLTEIKGVTFHNMKVVNENGLWRVKIIFDV